ncbi:hypothetical protein K439DRAFT_1637413 [Ramaria rubella]|nr:hypothetical protein K439DRAFT_1637413 [Ramaria rubella]
MAENNTHYQSCELPTVRQVCRDAYKADVEFFTYGAAVTDEKQRNVIDVPQVRDNFGELSSRYQRKEIVTFPIVRPSSQDGGHTRVIQGQGRSP